MNSEESGFIGGESSKGLRGDITPLKIAALTSSFQNQ
jgi:hypothetical protein